MPSTDPGDGPARPLPGDEPPVPGDGAAGDPDRPAGVPAPPLRDIVPPAAMANGGTILRPGAVAWGGTRETGPGGCPRYPSCEAIERALAAVVADPARLPGLLTELAGTRLWVPLPAPSSGRGRPFTDGTALRLPLVSYQGTDFVPCFTSVQRLSAWASAPGAQRAGDARTPPRPEPEPHVVVPAAGLARRLPGGIGLALNPGGSPGLPLYPDCVPYLARLTEAEPGDRGRGDDGTVMEPLPGSGARLLIGHPPAEPGALLAAARAALRALPPVAAASRAWLSVPGQGAGLVIAVRLDDPASDPARAAALGALERAAATTALRVPFPLDVTFTGEPATAARARSAPAPAAWDPDAIDAWIARNTRPFYVRA